MMNFTNMIGTVHCIFSQCVSLFETDVFIHMFDLLEGGKQIPARWVFIRLFSVYVIVVDCFVSHNR